MTSYRPRLARRQVPARALRVLGFVLGLASCAGCSPESTIEAEDRSPASTGGPRVVWDLGAAPFPELPLPNDIATRLDPSSPTGLRLNVSELASTAVERRLRAEFNQLDGWGTFMPISIPLDGRPDLEALRRRHGEDFDFRDDALYVVDLETGLPVPLDVGHKRLPLAMPNPNYALPGDPRRGGSNLLLSTFEEDLNQDGLLQPEEDGNFDGRLQHSSVFPAGGRAEDFLAEFWEEEDDHGSLLIRPMVPLRERHRYAVLLTTRIHDADGALRSPFSTRAHPSQLAALRPLRDQLANPTLQARFYGDLRWSETEAGAGASVAFAWVFSTQTTTQGLLDAREGLHGRGPLKDLAAITPDLTLFEARTRSATCMDAEHRNSFIVPGADLQALVASLAQGLGLGGAQADALTESFQWIDYAAVAKVQTPYLAGSPNSTDPEAHWRLEDLAAGRMSPGTDEVQLWIFVPKAQDGHNAPFPVVFNAHGYGSGAIQGIAFAGYFARFGLATICANGPDHGLPLDQGTTRVLQNLLSSQCMRPLSEAVVRGRSRDRNGDNNLDSGADFLTARPFRTRDMLRQHALDYAQLARAFSSAQQAEAVEDYNHDGRVDARGDFNGDGVVDLGRRPDGTTTPMFLWGESLGGINSMLAGAIEPMLTAVAPVSGGGSLMDLAMRSQVSGVVAAVFAPTLGPAIVAVPAASRGAGTTRARTSCTGAGRSVRWFVADGNELGELEIACSPEGTSTWLEPGDDVLVDVVGPGRTLLRRRCARVGSNGSLFVPLPVDQGETVELTVFAGRSVADYESCRPDLTVPLRKRVTQYEVGEGDCPSNCGHIPDGSDEHSLSRQNAVRTGDLLTAPRSGLGLYRQSSGFRRVLQLSQAAIDPGDPINYAPLFFLRPALGGPRPLLTMTTLGDTLVPVSTGNAFARAAGLLPFLQHATGTDLDNYLVPQALWDRYDASPDTVLAQNYVFEGLARLGRAPVPGFRNRLFDPDNLDEGFLGYGEQNLPVPLRLVRNSEGLQVRALFSDPAAHQSAQNALWAPGPGASVSAMLNALIEAEGTHTFLPSDPGLPWNHGLYYTNLIADYFASNATRLRYYTAPESHQCLANSSCPEIPQRAP